MIHFAVARKTVTVESVRAPEGCAERFIRTLKKNLLRVRTFGIIEELQVAIQKFKDGCNEKWLIQRHGHRSPDQF